MQARVDFQRVNDAALEHFDDLLVEWLPDGKFEGPEYKARNPTRHDGRPGSFSIHRKKGVWSDFATGDKGSDPVSLYAYLFTGEDQGAAARALSERFGLSAERMAPAPAPQGGPGPAAKKARRSLWVPLHPVPQTAWNPPAQHNQRGEPERVWTYRDAEGRVLGYVYRFRTSDGGKDTIPLSWARHEETGKEQWRWLSFAEPRALYGLDALARKPDAVVLLVEGEKCTDAAAAELPDLAVVSWPGGGKAVDKADWSLLKGRKVIRWPDADSQRIRLTRTEKDAGLDPESKPYLPASDQPGQVAMDKIGRKLHALGCSQWEIQIPAPGEAPDGWDVADLVESGVQGAALADYVRAHSRAWSPPERGAAEGSSTPSGAGAGGGKDTVPEWRRGLIYKERGALEDCRENVYLILSRHPEWDGVIGWNDFAYRIEKRKPTPSGGEPGEWTAQDDYDLGLWLAQRCQLLIKGEGTLGAGVAMLAHRRTFHPVRDWLEALPAWDGIERLDYWLSECLGVRECTYSKLSGRFFVLSMVARVYRPGCAAQHMLILEGPQGEGKSGALRVLGGAWFAETPFKIGDKDSYMQLNGAWLYEIPEMDAFNRAETTAVKAFLTVQVDRYREPYARRPVERPRQSVFAGNTNQGEYFKDPTGNRRFWPVRVGRLDLGKLEDWREQMFAEALRRFRSGERWHPSRSEEREYFQPEQEAREIVDPWLYPLEDYLAFNATASEFTSADLLTEGLKVPVDKVDGNRSMATRVGNLMHKLGWKKARRSTGKREWIYVRPAQASEGGEGVKAGGGDDAWPA